MRRLFIYIVLITITSLGLLIGIAHLKERKMHEKYKAEFNEFRLKKGIIPIRKFDDTTEVYWKDILPEDDLIAWWWILSNKEIATETYFENDSIVDRPYHYSKTVMYGTHLLFWQNFYGGEIDIFLNPISKDTTIRLFLLYHSASLNPGDFFYADLDTLYSNEAEVFLCGAPFLEDEYTPPVGNIDKNKADQILKTWKIK